MSGNSRSGFSNLEIYRNYEQLSEMLWNAVGTWELWHKDVLGKQLLRATDSIGANIAESVGRGHFRESLHHLYYARGSLAETQHWIRVAVRRQLIGDNEINHLRELSVLLHKQLNAFIRAQTPKSTNTHSVSEEPEIYGDDFLHFDRNPNEKPVRRRQELRAKSQEPTPLGGSPA